MHRSLLLLLLLRRFQVYTIQTIYTIYPTYPIYTVIHTLHPLPYIPSPISGSNRFPSLSKDDTGISLTEKLETETVESAQSSEYPFWYVGQRFFSVTENIAQELADWFGDPTIVSDWLVNQQEHMVWRQPLEVSPFASLVDKKDEMQAF